MTFKKKMKNITAVLTTVSTHLKKDGENYSDDEKFLMADLAFELDELLARISSNLDL